MKTLLLEQNKNNFAVERHWDRRCWTHTKTRLEYLSQKIRHTISIFKGEWFVDKSIGIPYIPGDDVSRGMHRRMIETALQVRIGEISGVKKFLVFKTTIDKVSRTLIVDFTVQIDTGEQYSDSVEIGG